MKLFLMIFVIISVAGCASTSNKKSPTAANDANSSPIHASNAKKEEFKAANKTTPNTTSIAGNVTCKLAQVERSINIVQNADSCTVEYTKDGNKSEIATGNLTSSYCKEVQDRVKNNLVAAGYSCK